MYKQMEVKLTTYNFGKVIIFKNLQMRGYNFLTQTFKNKKSRNLAQRFLSCHNYSFGFMKELL